MSRIELLASTAAPLAFLALVGATAPALSQEKQPASAFEASSDVQEQFADAVAASDRDKTAALLEKGATIDAPTKIGITPLQVACDNRDTGLVIWLLEHGASVDLPDQRGWTPMMHAVDRNHAPTIAALLSHGARVDGTGKEVLSPLGLALGEGKFHAAKALLDAGAKVDGKAAPQGVTPLMLIATRKDSEAPEVSVVRGPPPTELAHALLEKGAKVDAVSDHGVTALMIAAGSDNALMIDLLIKAGASPAAKSDQGKTALDIAQTAGNEAAVKALKDIETAKRG